MRYVKLLHIVGFWLLLAVLLLMIYVHSLFLRERDVIARLEGLGCHISLRYNYKKQEYYQNATIFGEVSSQRPSLLEALRQLRHVGSIHKLTIENCVFDDGICDEFVHDDIYHIVALELIDCEIRKEDLVRIKQKGHVCYIWSNSAEHREIIREVFGEPVSRVHE